MLWKASFCCNLEGWHSFFLHLILNWILYIHTQQMKWTLSVDTWFSRHPLMPLPFSTGVQKLCLSGSTLVCFPNLKLTSVFQNAVLERVKWGTGSPCLKEELPLFSGDLGDSEDTQIKSAHDPMNSFLLTPPSDQLLRKTAMARWCLVLQTESW